jgi:signal transduction histidine kinase
MMKPGEIRRLGIVLAVAAGLSSVALVTGLLPAEVARIGSDIVYPVVACGAGLAIVAGAYGREGSDRVSWLLFGAGVLLLGLGELSWVWYDLVFSREPPFPGIPDVFYLAAYPALLGAMLATPRLAANRYQRGQQAIDGVVITTALSIVAWLTVLGPMYRAAGDRGTAAFVVGAAYPVGDVLLVAAAATIGIRRSWRLRDRSLLCVVAALLVTALGDLVYLMQSWSDSYVSGSWVDSTWLAGYGLFALAAVWLPETAGRRPARDRRLPLVQVLVPAVVVFLIVGVHIGRKYLSGDPTGLPFDIGLSILGILVMTRILLVVAEDRRLLDAERTELVSVVSHELRTPLTAVQGYLDLVLADWGSLDDIDRREMISIARDQSGLVARIVTDLIATSRDNLHATELTIEPVNVASVVTEVAAVAAIGCEMEVVVPPGLAVAADRERLAQVVTNLVSNAARYGNGTVTCSARRANGSVEIAVHDDGPGVPPRYRDSVWDLFERGAHRFDAATPGSGLGLGIVRSLIVAHRGQTGYRPSELLGGACFWVRLPVPAGAQSQPSAPLLLGASRGPGE